MIPKDVERFIARRFAASDRHEAKRLLNEATIHDGTAASSRLIRCAAVASGGSLTHLRAEIDTLKIDWRDVIVAGEYVPGRDDLIRVRNLNDPIPSERTSERTAERTAERTSERTAERTAERSCRSISPCVFILLRSMLAACAATLMIRS